MSDSEASGRPEPQEESGKKHGDKLVPDLPRKQVGTNDAEQVKGGAYDPKIGYDYGANKKI